MIDDRIKELEEELSLLKSKKENNKTICKSFINRYFKNGKNYIVVTGFDNYYSLKTTQYTVTEDYIGRINTTEEASLLIKCEEISKEQFQIVENCYNEIENLELKHKDEIIKLIKNAVHKQKHTYSI